MAFYKSTAVVTSIERNSDGKWVMFAQSEKDGRLNLSEKVTKTNSFPYEICHIGDIVEYGHWNNGSVAPISNITYNSNKKIDALINNPRQDAVVLDYYYIDNNCRTYIRCWTPVWKEIEFNASDHIPLRYNDVITIEKLESGRYYVVENKTLTEEKEKVIKNKLLAGFTDAEVNRLLFASNGR